MFGQVLRYSLVNMSLSFRPSPVFNTLVRVTVLSILSPGQDFIRLSPGPGFIKIVRVRILSILSPDPGPYFIKAVRIPSPCPDFIHFLIRVLILFIESGSWSGFYSYMSPGPDFIKHVLSGSVSGSGFTNTLILFHRVTEMPRTII